MHALASRKADPDYDAAEVARGRSTQGDGIRFQSARRALQFFAEAPKRLSSAGMRAPKLREVEGLRRQDPHEVQATLLTLGADIEAARKFYPEGMAWALQQAQGVEQHEIADAARVSQATVSVRIGQAETFLRGCWYRAGMVG